MILGYNLDIILFILFKVFDKNEKNGYNMKRMILNRRSYNALY